MSFILEVKSFLDISDQEIDRVNEIFFESSARTHFSSQKKRERFQYKYLDYYKIYHPELFFVLCDPRPIGYICGVPRILKEKKLFELLGHLHAFKDYYEDYPAHLHINLDQECTGKGFGSYLLGYFEAYLREKKLKGVHLVTSPGARNNHFYLKNGYTFTVEKTYKDVPLLFMGKSL